MIQRIQTLYLALAWGLFFALFFTNIATLIMPDGLLCVFKLKGFYSVAEGSNQLISSQTTIFLMSCLINLLFLASIFTYRKRVIQLRVCIYLIVFLIGVLGLSLYSIFTTASANGAEKVFHIYAVFPVLSSILVYLAFRAIRKDEVLVKAYERLR